MKLFHSPTSPFVRKVMVMVAESGIPAPALLPVSGNPVDPGSMPVDHNPLGKIPCLLPEDGPAIHDSRVICRYLDARFGTGLYPEAPLLWRVLTMESTADGLTDAAVLMVYETRLRPEDRRHAPWVDGQWAKIDRALDSLDAAREALLSGPLHIGQIAAACALGYLDFRHADRGWRNGRPALADWYADFAARPSMQATIPH